MATQARRAAHGAADTADSDGGSGLLGAAGSLGRQLAPELVEHGHEVVCFDLKPMEGTPYRWLIGDVRVPEAVGRKVTVTVQEATQGVPTTMRSQRSSTGSMRSLWKIRCG